MKTRVEKIIDIANRLKSLKIKKEFKVLFYFVTVTFLMMNSLNAFAQDYTPPSVPDTYRDTTETFGVVNETKNPNVADATPKLFLSAVETGIVTLDPGVLSTKVSSADIHDFSKMGLLGITDATTKIALYNPPQIDVIQHFAEEWIPGKKVENYSTFASGYEYLSSLKISDLWDKVRNVCYVFFVVILIVAGFMIMFRQKIGGQVAITIYNTIPNVIIGLVLVTFSFAIVGLILDVGAMALNLIKGFFGYADPSAYTTLESPFRLLEGGRRAATYVNAFGEGYGQTSLAEAARLSALGSSNDPIVAGFNSMVSGFIGGLVGMIIALVVLVLFTFAAIKVFITVFKAFLAIIFDTILGPIYITMAVIPGKESARTEWLNRVVKNVAVFPVVFFMVNLPGYFMANGIIMDMTGIGTGNLTAVTGASGFTETLIAGLLPLFLYFMAAEAPKFLNDIFPSNTAKGVAEATGALKKMPLVGGFF